MAELSSYRDASTGFNLTSHPSAKGPTATESSGPKPRPAVTQSDKAGKNFSGGSVEIGSGSGK